MITIIFSSFQHRSSQGTRYSPASSVSCAFLITCVWPNWTVFFIMLMAKYLEVGGLGYSCILSSDEPDIWKDLSLTFKINLIKLSKWHCWLHHTLWCWEEILHAVWMGSEGVKIGPHSALILAVAFIVWLTWPAEFGISFWVVLNIFCILNFY